jgi:hypothetical protein
MGNTEGIAGGWDKLFLFQQGYYLAGISLKNEDPCGDCDDTAANGIKAYYCDFQGESCRWQELYNDFPGNWRSAVCPKGQFVKGMHVRNEGYQGKADDTALNGIKIICSPPR